MKRLLFSSFLLSASSRKALRLVCLSLLVLFGLLCETSSNRLPRTSNPYKTCYQYRNYRPTSYQLRYCTNDHALFENVASVGVKLKPSSPTPLFEEECQYWMAVERWNCSGIKAPLFLGQMQPFVHHLTKETAFTQALLSALSFIKVARGCTSETFTSCKCMAGSSLGHLNRNEKWDLCMDNTVAANQATQRFLDEMWQDTRFPDEERLVQIHNLEAGRRAVMAPENYRKECKCHGMTGDCISKTCFKKVKSPRVIAEFIKRDLYHKAEKVALLDKLHGAELFTVKPIPTKPSHTSLVFTEDSPNYCVSNSIEYGALNVSGRECVESQQLYHHHRKGICDEICCNGHRVVVTEEEYICRCVMNDCQTTCTRKVVRNFCQ
uniref:Protein Wnt n=1 Tax=Halisarca dujardinii TaxID=2583056 RepID=A0A175C1Q6_HALDU